MLQFIVFSIACPVTGFSKAGLGGGVGVLVTVLMLLVFPPQTAIAISLPMLIAADWTSARTMWGAWETVHLRRLLPGMVVGAVVGTYVLATAPSEALRRLIRLFMLLFVATWRWIRGLAGRPAISGRLLGTTTGVSAGVTSAIAHLGGPPVTGYLLLQRLAPLQFFPTTVLIFGTLNLIKVPAFVAADVFDWGLQLRLAPALVFIPPVWRPGADSWTTSTEPDSRPWSSSCWPWVECCC